MTSVAAAALNFRIGARTVLRVRRKLVPVGLGLEAARTGRLPPLPALSDDAQGYIVTSLPEDRIEAMRFASGGMIAFVRQRYLRYYADLTGTFEGYLAGLSSSARQGVKRKAKRLAQVSGGALDVRQYRTPAELETFHALARGIAVNTYQERLMGEGLPGTSEFVAAMLALGAADRVRAWLLHVDDKPAAYLYCPAQGDTLIYEYVGHDPAYNELSPGAVLQIEAFRDLFAEAKFARFDFTEGEGQHKRQFSTGGVACADLLLLRPSVANRAAVAALGGFNRAVAGGKALVDAAGLEGLSRKLRRG